MKVYFRPTPTLSRLKKHSACIRKSPTQVVTTERAEWCVAEVKESVMTSNGVDMEIPPGIFVADGSLVFQYVPMAVSVKFDE